MSIIEEAKKYIGRRVVFPHFDEWVSAQTPNLSIATVVRVFQKVLHPKDFWDGAMEWWHGRPPVMVFFLLELEEPHDIEIPGVTIPDAARKFLVLDLYSGAMDQDFSGSRLSSGHLYVITEERVIQSSVLRTRDLVGLAKYPVLKPV